MVPKSRILKVFCIPILRSCVYFIVDECIRMNFGNFPRLICKSKPQRHYEEESFEREIVQWTVICKKCLNFHFKIKFKGSISLLWLNHQEYLCTYVYLCRMYICTYINMCNHQFKVSLPLFHLKLTNHFANWFTIN